MSTHHFLLTQGFDGGVCIIKPSHSLYSAGIWEGAEEQECHCPLRYWDAPGALNTGLGPRRPSVNSGEDTESVLLSTAFRCSASLFPCNLSILPQRETV